MSSAIAKSMTKIYTVVVHGFVLEYHGKFDQAIVAHQASIELLEKLMPTIKKNMLKAHRKMFERQLDVLRERKFILEKAALTSPRFAGVLMPPTVLSADAELKANGRSTDHVLSMDQKTICEWENAKPRDVDLKAYNSTAPENIRILFPENVPKFASTLNPSLPPTAYRISHDSELLMLGQRSHWMFVKDSTDTNTLYAMQAIWMDDAPITEAVLRRAGEFLPAAGAVTVTINRVPGGGAYWLKLQNPRVGMCLELPDRASKSKNWSPRRFSYGHRKFVWKDTSDGKMFSKFQWDTLYETSREWPKQGSKTGKKEDEVVGERLCWGVNHGGTHANHTIYIAGGVDQHFREHMLASQLARYLCKTYPSAKEPSKTTAAAGVVGMLSVGASLFL
ncbi:hypothetical protein D6C98_03972 [Aureobasidium pullulans]|nr:hypothetical protein D6D00_08431 [Aureobasidium pullulans]THY55912.1 hypothetical protein D6C98_03972 [Aureobasidium pullulans]THY82116.1 hypothetical protein D6C93_09318 [Aureobasidium pullulans]